MRKKISKKREIAAIFRFVNFLCPLFSTFFSHKEEMAKAKKIVKFHLYKTTQKHYNVKVRKNGGTK